MVNKKIKFGIIILAAIVVIVLAFWVVRANETRIAMVNFPNFQYAKMVKSNDNDFIKLEQLTLDDFDKLKRYDAVLIFGMGIRMTDEHRGVLEQLKNKNILIYSTAVTDPDNKISTLDSTEEKQVAAYLGNGGAKNYRSLFNYIRKDILEKRFFNKEVEAPIEINSNILFHLGEETAYNTVEEFETYYREKGYYKEGAPKVAIICGMTGPFDTDKAYLDSLIISLERHNFNVYPVSSVVNRMEFLETISPDAVVYMPHGRLLMGQGDKGVEWLQQRNIPLFCPLTILSLRDEWMESKQGMLGGFLSQSVVMPELDGGILSFALFAQEIDDEGLYSFQPIPGRMQKFTNTIANYLDLKKKANKDKHIAIYYYKGPGNNAMTAFGLEVIPSLYHFIKRLQSEGYTVKNLPATVKEFENLIMEKGAVFNSYAEGNIARYLHSGYPALVTAQQYDAWLKAKLLPQQYDALTAKHGKAPGNYYTLQNNDQQAIAVTRIDLGNIVLLPQPVQGTGENTFAAVHGDNPIPPHHYIASYFWVQDDFHADAMIHFGTHGSLEFIPGKQLALSSADWTDVLVGELPHFYYYTIADVGEGIIAKRRSYATTVTHLSPPFIETELRDKVNDLQQNIRQYLEADKKSEALNLKIKTYTVKMGLHRDLKLDSLLTKPYNEEEIIKINNFAEELCNEKIIGGQHIFGIPFEQRKIQSSVEMMGTDPIAYSLAALDKLKGKVTQKQLEDKSYFRIHYYIPAQNVVRKLLANPALDINSSLLSLGVSQEDITKAQDINERMQPQINRMIAMMMEQAKSKKGKLQHPAGISKDGEMPDFVKKKIAERKEKEQKAEAERVDAMAKEAEKNAVPKEDREFAQAILAIETTVKNINKYREALKESTESELDAMVRALNGEYILPTSGGDFIANPNTVPTGRNLYSINAEATPTPQAWDKGVLLGKALLDDYRKKHDNKYPEKVSFTLWSGSFIESEGATIAQILYLLGVEPVRDQFNRVLDVRLLPENELEHPRIDVIVQTSGQFRDLAASRLSLIQKAVDMAANSNDKQQNYVAKGKESAEKVMLEKGFSPKEARELSTARIFGGLNGMAGTGITSMVESGDKWEKENEIAQTYLNNMGAVYGSEQSWGDFKAGVFEAALQNTDVVIQPRQSNTWGALSLDHVYEFMGGMTLTVRNVTGKDPDNYFNDLRNHYNVRLQDLKAAIGVEARTTIFNPTYIKEQMTGASAANGFADIIRNTYGWNVMKPDVIDNELWNEIYDTYVQDKNNLNLQSFFEKENPAALQEITAVMIETYRKGYWKASAEQINILANLHAELVNKYEAGCSGFVCDNMKLQAVIAQQLSQEQQNKYNAAISKALEIQVADKDGIVMEKETLQDEPISKTNTLYTGLIAFGILAFIIILFFIISKRKKNE
ncbi:MAG: cobaltochelatase subunit CobN [Bacteroidales bacterium]|jgi:cobaltochelatase CobN|nr:cobaltochelatase subunit CobN [Bacteroidales bacterium]